MIVAHEPERGPVTLYGQCAHPAIQKGPDGRWYCTECGQLRS